MLRVTDLHVRYGEMEAVRGVSFEVRAGEAVAVLGAKAPAENKVSKFRARVTTMTAHEAGRSAAAEVRVGLALVG